MNASQSEGLPASPCCSVGKKALVVGLAPEEKAESAGSQVGNDAGVCMG